MSLEARRVLPTKINLIRLRKEEQVIKKIRKVLDEKRNVLLLYVREAIEEYEEKYRKATELLEDAYKFYYKALMKTGYEKVKSVAETVPRTFRITVGERALFAVKVPTIIPQTETLGKPSYDLAEVPPELVEASTKLKEAMFNMLKLVETEVALRSLIEELRKTQRLINAIDYALLPAYDRAIRYIRLILDERMREEFIRLKMLKRKLAERGA